MAGYVSRPSGHAEPAQLRGSFRRVASAAFRGIQATPVQDGVFQRFTASAVPSAPAAAKLTAVRPAEVTGDRSPSAIVEESWKTRCGVAT